MSVPPRSSKGYPVEGYQVSSRMSPRTTSLILRFEGLRSDEVEELGTAFEMRGGRTDAEAIAPAASCGALVDVFVIVVGVVKSSRDENRATAEKD